jgi:hypothetical protein
VGQTLKKKGEQGKRKKVSKKGEGKEDTERREE